MTNISSRSYPKFDREPWINAKVDLMTPFVRRPNPYELSFKLPRGFSRYRLGSSTIEHITGVDETVGQGPCVLLFPPNHAFSSVSGGAFHFSTADDPRSSDLEPAKLIEWISVALESEISYRRDPITDGGLVMLRYQLIEVVRSGLFVVTPPSTLSPIIDQEAEKQLFKQVNGELKSLIDQQIRDLKEQIADLKTRKRESSAEMNYEKFKNQIVNRDGDCLVLLQPDHPLKQLLVQDLSEWLPHCRMEELRIQLPSRDQIPEDSDEAHRLLTTTYCLTIPAKNRFTFGTWSPIVDNDAQSVILSVMIVIKK